MFSLFVMVRPSGLRTGISTLSYKLTNCTPPKNHRPFLKDKAIRGLDSGTWHYIFRWTLTVKKLYGYERRIENRLFLKTNDGKCWRFLQANRMIYKFGVKSLRAWEIIWLFKNVNIVFLPVQMPYYGRNSWLSLAIITWKYFLGMKVSLRSQRNKIFLQCKHQGGNSCTR